MQIKNKDFPYFFICINFLKEYINNNKDLHITNIWKKYYYSLLHFQFY